MQWEIEKNGHTGVIQENDSNTALTVYCNTCSTLVTSVDKTEEPKYRLAFAQVRTAFTRHTVDTTRTT